MPVVKAEASQVETDQAPELEAIEVVRVLAVKALAVEVVVKVRALVTEVLALKLLLKNIVNHQLR